MLAVVVLAACQAEMPDEETLQRLSLSMEPTMQLQPGEKHDFSVGVVECCYFFREIDVPVKWRITPTEGATINSRTGVFRVDKNTPPGSVYTVTASVLGALAAAEIDVYIYSLAETPLIGRWKEDKQYTCDSGEEVMPAEAIRELVFDADGTFSVTWFPFEVYRDYWGTYSYNEAKGDLKLTVDSGNYVPEDIDGSGKVRVDDDQGLILEDMWLGSHESVNGSKNCGHRFVK